MNEGGIAQFLENPLPSASFITFNYDRFIEQFLALAIAQIYKIDFDRSMDIAENIPVEHVYGSLGPIAKDKVDFNFGSKTYPQQYAASIPNIRTFTEQVDSQTADRISSLIMEAERIIFLGFSFGKMNQEFLREAYTGKYPMKSVYGTSHGLSHQDATIAMAWADRCFRDGNGGTRLDSVKSADFFDQNYLMLR